MSTTLIAAGAALATVAGLWLLTALLRARGEQRFERALERIDDHMAAIVEHVRLASERMPLAQPGLAPIEPTLDLPSLLERVAREASARTSAPAAVVQLEGPDGVSARGSFGDPPRHELLHGPLAASPEVYRAVTVDWSHVASDSGDSRVYGSALVVPLASDGGTRGALAVYGWSSDAFRHDDVRALESLAAEVSPVVASACRVAAVERVATTDEATGLRNERAYEQELDREVARSRRSGRTFALLVLELAEPTPPGPADSCVWEFAGLVLEATRSTDVVCRRGEQEFVLLLPETDADGAARVLSRIEVELGTRSFRVCAPVVGSAQFVEWHAGESARAVDTRARRGTSPTGDALYRPVAATGPRSGPSPRPLDARDAFVAALADDIERARERSEELSLLLLEPDVRASADGASSARAVLLDLAARLDEDLAGLASCSRTGRNQLGVALPGADERDAERRFAEVRDWLAERGGGVTLAGGVGMLGPSDRADVLFGRAQHALWQAKQAGGTAVVVAVTPDASGS